MTNEPTRVQPDTTIHGLNTAIEVLNLHAVEVYDNHQFMRHYNLVFTQEGRRRDGLSTLEVIEEAHRVRNAAAAEALKDISPDCL